MGGSSAQLESLASPLATLTSFNGTLAPGGRHFYRVTLATPGVDIHTAVMHSGSSQNTIGLLFGLAANGPTCGPGLFGFFPASGSHTVATDLSSNHTELRTASTRALAPDYCVAVLDPNGLTSQDALPPSPIPVGNALTAPVNYTVTIGISGAGGSVVAEVR